MSVNCLIIDDKPLAIDILANYTLKVPFLKLIATTTNPIEGLSIVREDKIDLVFLDIQMAELTGLQFMKIAGKQCKVVLTTAYSEFALDGFEHDVIDYLLKPISFDRFYRAAEKALQVLGNDGKTQSLKKIQILQKTLSTQNINSLKQNIGYKRLIYVIFCLLKVCKTISIYT